MGIYTEKPFRTLDSLFSYSCKRCNKCCQDKIIQVNPYELLRLSECLSIDTTTIRKTYLDNNFLKQKENSKECIFLNEEGCSVHCHRPLVCRLYPLGRINLNDGKEFYTELAPHPESKGEYGVISTVRKYLEDQGAFPYFDAEKEYRELIRKMISKAFEKTNLEYLLNNFNLTNIDDQKWILDPDPVIQRYCKLKGITFPLKAEEKLKLHIESLNAWIEGTWEIWI